MRQKFALPLRVCAMIAAVCGVVFALSAFPRAAVAGQLIKVHDAARNLTTAVAAKEQVTWWNHDKDRPVTVTFAGPLPATDFSTDGSRFLFTEEKTLTSNLIPPGAVASVSFDTPGEYHYVITGLSEDIHGTIIVRR